MRVTARQQWLHPSKEKVTYDCLGTLLATHLECLPSKTKSGILKVTFEGAATQNKAQVPFPSPSPYVISSSGLKQTHQIRPVHVPLTKYRKPSL